MSFTLQPSSHRQVLLRVAQRLSKDDVDQIVFLLEDGSVPRCEVEQISSGVGLMRSLEQHGKVAPGRYFYLLSCLRDIGRYDLASLVTQSEPAASYLPLCFQMPTQLLHLKFQTLQRKQERYLQSKQQLKAATNIEFWQSLWVADTRKFSEMSRLFYDGRSFSKATQAFLYAIPKRILVIANALENFHKDKDLRILAEEIQMCSKIGQDAMNAIRQNMAKLTLHESTSGEKSQRYRSFVSVTTDAHDSLCDFLADLVGEEIVKRWSKNITEDIALTSDAITVNYPYCWDLLSYIVGFLGHINGNSYAEIEGHVDEKYKSFMKEQLEVYKDTIQSNITWIAAVLEGTSVVDCLKHDGILDEKVCKPQSGNFSAHVAHLAHASLLVVLLHYWDNITQTDWKIMKNHFSEFIHTKAMELSSNYCGFEDSLTTGFSNILDGFRNETLHNVLGNSEETQQLIVDIFHN